MNDNIQVDCMNQCHSRHTKIVFVHRARIGQPVNVICRRVVIVMVVVMLIHAMPMSEMRVLMCMYFHMRNAGRNDSQQKHR